MLELDLTREEQKVLEETLENCVSDLHSEIMYTDRRDYKELLKHRREIMLRILEAVRHSESTESAT